MPAERRRRFLSTLGHLALSRFLLPLAIDIAMLLLSVFCLALCGAFFPAYSVPRSLSDSDADDPVPSLG